MIALLDVVAANGVPFRVAFLPAGEWLTNEARVAKQPVAEFYDRRYDHTAGGHGQFTGGYYYTSTLLEGQDDAGLALQGGLPEWTVDGQTMALVRSWLRSHLAAGDEPMTRGCEGCGAEPGEPCRVGCLGLAAEQDTRWAKTSTCATCAKPIVQERDDPWMHDETGEERCYEDKDEFATPTVAAEEGTCRHCERRVVKDDEGRWVDPEAPATLEDGDDHIWRETCDRNESFVAVHEIADGSQ